MALPITALTEFYVVKSCKLVAVVVGLSLVLRGL
jgi:hypothetical protein